MKDWGRFYFSFKGRATRMDFNVRFALVSFVGLLAAYGLDCLRAGAVVSAQKDMLFYNAFSVLMTVSCFAVTARRLHDLNHSGWWQAAYYAVMVLISTVCLYVLGMDGFAYQSDADTAPMTQNQMILIVGTSVVMLAISLYFIILLSAKRGTVGPNTYGDDPLLKFKVEE